MSPETKILDRVFRGVGRIKRASGTTHPVVFRKVNAMLTELHDQGRLDLLRAIRDGELAPLQVYDAFQRRALHALPVGGTAAPLVETMRAWAAEYDCSPHYRATIKTTVGYLETEAPKALVADLARTLEALRKTLGKAYPSSFNHARAHALAFVRSTLKKSHPLWLEVSAVERVKERRQRKPRPLTVDEMRERFPAPQSDAVDAIAWGMATTGMHAAEYWGRWAALADRVHVQGTKRKGRVRDVPLVRRPAAPAMRRRPFEDAIRERFDDMTVYDLRRTYANWLEAAGVPRTRRRMYLGHGAGDVTDLYERHEVEAYLAEDAAKLARFTGLSHDSSHGLEVVK